MIELLKEVGRGKRGARDLTYAEAQSAAEKIVSLEATPAQIGAFLVAERLKMENVDELAAFVSVCRARAFRTTAHHGIDCAGPYDGRRKSFMATFAVAFVLASAGIPVTLHGTPPMPPKWGVTLHDMLIAAGISPVDNRERVLRVARQTGVLYVDAECWCPPLGMLRPIREQLGLRTIFNTAEKLIDYAHSPYLVFGVFHNTVFDRLSRLLTRLGYRRAIIVQGVEGSEDLFIDRPTRICLVQNGETMLQSIVPQMYGLTPPPAPEIQADGREQLRLAELALRGEGHLAHVQQLLLNSAVRLYAAERAGSIEEGLRISQSLLESGLAWQNYVNWKHALQIVEA